MTQRWLMVWWTEN